MVGHFMSLIDCCDVVCRVVEEHLTASELIRLSMCCKKRVIFLYLHKMHTIDPLSVYAKNTIQSCVISLV
jgi:hypothetical protein